MSPAPTTNTAPTPIFEATIQNSGIIPAQVSFVSSSTDSDGSIATHTWSFGDGSADVTGSASTVEHTYDAIGTFTATLTVTDDDGATSSISTDITTIHPIEADPSSLTLTEENQTVGVSVMLLDPLERTPDPRVVGL